MANCYLCGAANATKRKATILKTSFTNHNMARCPDSDYLCDRCAWVIPLRCAYFNPHKGSYVKLFARSWSWLLSQKESYPKFGDPVDKLPEVTELPTRAKIREWLVNPPEPPFTIAIAESGQKHILPWAREARSRDRFPVQFELDSLWVQRSQFLDLLQAFEELMGMGFSKTEIVSGEYRPDRLMPVLSSYQQWEDIVQAWRGTRLMDLVAYVATTTTDT
jgi:hypothetical protein